MAYTIDRFGAAYASAEELPRLDGRQPQGAGAVESSLVRLIGGQTFDWRGSGAALIPHERITIRGEWVASSAGGMKTKLADLKALRGTRSKLWRTSDGDSQKRTARCLAVSSELRPGSPSWAEISMEFELDAEPWSGTARDNLTELEDNPQGILVANGGNAPVRNAIITVTAAGTNITSLTIYVSGVSSFTWTGTLAVGKSLVIDCGASSVKNDGTDAYSGFSLNSGHTIPEWLRLEPGNNTVYVQRTGGSTASTARFTYNDGWA